MELEGKVAILTGAGSGLGRATCLTLARAGARVVVADISISAAHETAQIVEAAGGTAAVAIGDVSRPDVCDAIVRTALTEFGQLDYLYNGAGVEGPGTILDFDDADLWRVFGVNTFAVMYMCRAAIPAIRDHGGGAIVNVSSAVALSSRPNMPIYVASKGAVVALTRSLAIDCASMGIRANCICPTAHDTAMTQVHYDSLADPEAEVQKNLGTVPLARWGSPGEFGESVLFLLSPRSGYITGHTLVVDGGQLAGRMSN
jgi:NAD(P)-dependent dehydrogenase (short-subunit alcohol dehydrogenase family)